MISVVEASDEGARVEDGDEGEGADELVATGGNEIEDDDEEDEL